MTDTQQPREAGPVAPQAASDGAAGVQEPEESPRGSQGRSAVSPVDETPAEAARQDRAYWSAKYDRDGGVS